MYIQLTEEQMNNLVIFLNRVDLKGHEVNAFLIARTALVNPVELPAAEPTESK